MVDHYSRNTTPHISHLAQNIEEVASRKLDYDHMEYVAELSTIYLKIFDMIPLIDQSTSAKDKEFLLLSKKYMALLLRDDLFEGINARISLTKTRKKIVQAQPELLNF